MDRLELAQALAVLPQRDFMLVMEVTDHIRNGITHSTSPKAAPHKFASTPGKKRGRPKGSKNKPKLIVPVETPEAAMGSTDLPPVPAHFGLDGHNA